MMLKQRKRITVCMLVCLSILIMLPLTSLPLPKVSHAATSIFTPTEDAFTTNGTTNVNNAYIKIQNSGTQRVGYLKFDVSGISGTVSSVVLRLFNSTVSGTPQIRIYEGDSNSWSESTITAATAPSEGLLLGSYDSTIAQNETISIDLGTSITTDGTYSFIIKANNTNGNEAWFHSSEATSGQPELEIASGTIGDSTAPAAVNDLVDASPSSGSVNLSWTAPGDDGSTGTAASYDIRYSTAPITEANWSMADRATGEPIPAVANTGQSDRVNGLSANTTYYFAMKTIDEAGNVSSLSNNTNATTLITELPDGGDSCDHHIPSNSTVQFNGDSSGLDAQPGDVVCIDAGNRPARLHLINFHGTEQNPIIFVNYGGQVVIDDNYWWTFKIGESSHFRVTGTGDPNVEYGFKFSQNFNGQGAVFEIKDSSTDYELDHIELADSPNGISGNGFSLKTHPECDGSITQDNFTTYNTIIRDNKVGNIVGEGIYLGSSWYHTGDPADCDNNGSKESKLPPPPMKGVRVYNNIISDTGRDGIQLGSATHDVEVYNNTIENVGTGMQGGHRSGIQINPGTSGRFYNNFVRGSSEIGIFDTGRGDTLIFNNVIVNPGDYGMIAGDRVNSLNPLWDGSPTHIFNNTIIDPNITGIAFRKLSQQGNTIRNNIIVHPDMDDESGRLYFEFRAGADITESHNETTIDIADPVFVNAGIDDYHLQSTSPLIDAGMDLTSYGVTYDYDYHARPVGAFDIGAFEYVAP